jgi:hypothetical protein
MQGPKRADHLGFLGLIVALCESRLVIMKIVSRVDGKDQSCGLVGKVVVRLGVEVKRTSHEKCRWGVFGRRRGVGGWALEYEIRLG